MSPTQGEGDLPKGDVTPYTYFAKWVTRAGRGQKSQKMGDVIYGRSRPQKGSCGDSFFCQPTVQQYELSIIRTDMCCQYIRRKFFFVKLTYNSKTLKKIKIFQLLAVSTIFCYTFFSGISKLRCCCSNSRRNYYFHIMKKKQ